jgi:hypothetical protein
MAVTFGSAMLLEMEATEPGASRGISIMALFVPAVDLADTVHRIARGLQSTELGGLPYCRNEARKPFARTG